MDPRRVRAHRVGDWTFIGELFAYSEVVGVVPRMAPLSAGARPAVLSMVRADAWLRSSSIVRQPSFERYFRPRCLDLLSDPLCILAVCPCAASSLDRLDGEGP